MPPGFPAGIYYKDAPSAVGLLLPLALAAAFRAGGRDGAAVLVVEKSAALVALVEKAAVVFSGDAGKSAGVARGACLRGDELPVVVGEKAGAGFARPPENAAFRLEALYSALFADRASLEAGKVGLAVPIGKKLLAFFACVPKSVCFL